MSGSKPNLNPYLQLIRLPNLFTAVADPLAGWFIVGGGAPHWHVALLVAASGCLYTSGIVLNDCFDYQLDCVERPERPLPRGEISRGTAWSIGIVLMLAGLFSAFLVSHAALGIAMFIAAMILFYNGWSKRFALLGSLSLGVCRFANLLLGMRCSPPRLWIAPAVLGIYVTVLTLIARNEVVNPAVRRTVKRLLLGIIVLDAIAVVAMTGDWHGALLVLSLLVPAMVLGKLIPMT